MNLSPALQGGFSGTSTPSLISHLYKPRTVPIRRLAEPGATSPACRAYLRCPESVSYTHLRAHETPEHLVCRLLLEKKKKNKMKKKKTKKKTKELKNNITKKNKK